MIYQYTIEIEIVSGAWEVDILQDRDPTPLLIDTLIRSKTLKIELDTTKDYVYRYVIEATKGTQFKLKVNGAEFASGKTNSKGVARGKGPLN